MKKLIFLLVILNSIASLTYFYYVLISNHSISNISPYFYYQKSKKQLEYTPNKEYLINNNLAQYSSYIIIDKDENKKNTLYRIEALVQFNYKYIKNFGSKDNFKCVLKLIKFINGNMTEEFLEIEASESPKFYWNSNKKFIFQFDPSRFKTYTSHFDLKKVVVAVIWKNDYDSTLDQNSFYLESVAGRVVLSYSLIKFQKPTIIKSLDQRLASVSFCVHYTYAIPSQIINWIDYHLSFGVREIMIYDGMENKNLTKYLNANYGDDARILIIPYNISLKDLCDKETLLQQLDNLKISVKNLLIKLCEEFYDNEFRDRLNWRSKHEQLTVNDCFTVMKNKHEFIGYYDLDEFVYPRTLDNLNYLYETANIYSCSNKKEVCNASPFNYQTEILEANHFYNYLHSLIQKYRNGREINKLSSISFSHAALIPSIDIEIKLINDLNLIIKQIENPDTSSTTFPLKIFVNEPPFVNQGHFFLIEKNDVDYIKYLYKSYNSLIPCAQEGFLKLIDTKKFDNSLVRYFYYLTEPNERMGKTIHYYKNVKSLFVHYAEESSEDHWLLSPSQFHGHFISHYRMFPKQKRQNFTGSIRKLNIDFEYIFFLLKKFTNFC